MLKELLSVYAVTDYADRLGIAYNNEAMSAGMGSSTVNVGMQGFLYYVMDKEGKKVDMSWMGLLSDWREQDARTCFANLYKLIKYFQKELKTLKHSD